MSNQEWPADDYAVGSWIQATVADDYLGELDSAPNARVLDVGCGNGAYTRNILNLVPDGSVLGIDASENMLKLAREVIRDYPNFSVQKDDVLTMDFPGQFDYVVSFWCLQWAKDIVKAFSNMMNALKPGGKVLAIFPVGDDPYIMGYYAMRETGHFHSLVNFSAPVDYTRLDNLPEKLKSIPCKRLQVEVRRHSVILPSLEVFRKFVNGIAFYQGQVPDDEVKKINEAMVQYFDAECKKHYRGEYQFNFGMYLVRGEK